MTIDEAIEQAEERACGNNQCAKDHAQLADWLRELRRARMEIDLLKTLRDGFKADAQRYKAENAKLRKLVRDMMGFFEDGDWCTKCNHALECESQEQYEDDCLMRFVFRDRMRELGIEANYD